MPRRPLDKTLATAVRLLQLHLDEYELWRKALFDWHGLHSKRQTDFENAIAALREAIRIKDLDKVKDQLTAFAALDAERPVPPRGPMPNVASIVDLVDRITCLDRRQQRPTTSVV